MVSSLAAERAPLCLSCDGTSFPFREAGAAEASFAPARVAKVNKGFQGDDSMPDEILNAMRALREDTRRLLLQSPEYRALVAIEAAIDEIAAILQERRAHEAPAPAPELPVQPRPVASEIQLAPEAVQPREAPAPTAATEAPPSPAARHSAIATAFAETLAAKLDPRNAGRQAAAYQPSRRAHFE
jgi:hypothetical protein